MIQPTIDTKEGELHSSKPCPFCAEPINLEARKCIHCGEFITKDWTGFKNRTLWDLISVFIVPICLLIFGWLFTLYQGNLEQSRADAAIELQATSDANRERASLLEQYLNDLSLILLEEDFEDESVVAIVRSRTIPIVRDLDSNRNAILVGFLQEAGAIDWVFRETDLNNAQLVKADLSKVNLSRANLSEADLRGANLYNADLRNAILLDAKMFQTNLSKANLSEATLSGADLSAAFLPEANLSKANLAASTDVPLLRIDAGGFSTWVGGAVNLRGAYLAGADLTEADLTGADLTGADLTGANLTGADLTNADLSGTNLTGAILVGADLRQSDLSSGVLQYDSSSHVNLPYGVVFPVAPSDLGLPGADLNGADLSGANLEGAKYDSETIWPAGFNPVLEGAVFED